jgi:hypothetical protein
MSSQMKNQQTSGESFKMSRVSFWLWISVSQQILHFNYIWRVSIDILISILLFKIPVIKINLIVKYFKHQNNDISELK